MCMLINKRYLRAYVIHSQQSYIPRDKHSYLFYTQPSISRVKHSYLSHMLYTATYPIYFTITWLSRGVISET